MKIVRANPSHIEDIKKLAESLRFNPKNPKNNSSITILNDSEYLDRINNSKFFLLISSS